MNKEINCSEEIVEHELKEELATLLNKYSSENGSDTPDFILAQYLLKCLDAYETAIYRRENWYGRKVGSWKDSVLEDNKN